MVVILTLGVLGNRGCIVADKGMQLTKHVPGAFARRRGRQKHMAGTHASLTGTNQNDGTRRVDRCMGVKRVLRIKGTRSRMVVQTDPWSCCFDCVRVAFFGVKYQQLK